MQQPVSKPRTPAEEALQNSQFTQSNSQQDAVDETSIDRLAFKKGHLAPDVGTNSVILPNRQRISKQLQENEKAHPQPPQAKASSTTILIEASSQPLQELLATSSLQSIQEPVGGEEDESQEDEVPVPPTENKIEKDAENEVSKTEDISVRPIMSRETSLRGVVHEASTTRSISTIASAAQEAIVDRSATKAPSTTEPKRPSPSPSTKSDKEDCSICKNPYSSRSMLQPRGHVFDFKCIMTWLEEVF